MPINMNSYEMPEYEQYQLFQRYFPFIVIINNCNKFSTRAIAREKQTEYYWFTLIFRHERKINT